jgi:hypothetical protein
MKMKPGKKMHTHAGHTDTILTMIKNSCAEELDCQSVFEHMEVYADFILKRGDAPEMVHLIEQHLAICGDCAEEFSLLLKALKE